MNPKRTIFVFMSIVVAGFIALHSEAFGLDSAAAGREARRASGIVTAAQGQLYHGVYPGGVTGEEDDVTALDLDSYEQTVGKTAAWVYVSHNWYRSRSFPAENAGWIRQAGSVPFIRLMLWSSLQQDRREWIFTLRRIIRGAFDSDFRQWAREAAAFGSPIIVEFGTEVNGQWFPWNGFWNGRGFPFFYGDPAEPNGPERFRDAYRHIVEIMREEASNITWVFHANNEDWPDTAWNRLENYYPGDDVVDWIGVSVYGALTPMDTEWPRFRDSMEAVYPRLAALSTDKPIAVLEFGAAAHNSLGDQAQWARDALTDLTGGRWPRVIGFSWWNETWQNDENPEHDTTMRVQDNPGLAQVFKELVGAKENILGRLLLGPLGN